MKKMKFIAGIASLMLAATALVPVNASAATMTFTQGDVNGDGRVSVNDLYAISQYLRGEKTADSNWTTRMDADYDKIIDRTDLEMISKFCSEQLTPERNKSTTILTASMNEERTYVKYDVATNTVSRYTLNSLDTLTNQMAVPLSIDEGVGVPNAEVAVVEVNYSTGFIIGNHTIATSGHGVYHPKDDVDTNGFTNNLAIVYDDNNIAHNLTISSIHIPENYYLYKDNNEYFNYRYTYDYALVTVEEDLSQYGSMQLGVATDEFIQTGKDISVAGFPAGYRERHSISGTIKPDSNIEPDYRLRFDTSIRGGYSGGPIYYIEDDKSKTVIGILTHHVKNSSSGPRISSTLLHFYYNNDNI